MTGRVCLITGATSGIGRAAARALAGLGATVVLTGRNPDRGARLVQSLREKHPMSQAEFHGADLSSQQSVCELAAAITARHHRIDVLINNAGARIDQYAESADGIELTFATNHLGHFQLTHLLAAPLMRSDGGRVITVTSGVHRTANLDGRWVATAGTYDRRQAYARSKLANILFAFELARRLAGTHVVSNAVDPGVAATRFAANNGPVAWAKHVFSHLVRAELVSAAVGADTIVHLAAAPEGAAVTGRLFRDRRAVDPAPAALDRTLAAGLWTESARLTGLEGFAFPSPGCEPLVTAATA